MLLYPKAYKSDPVCTLDTPNILLSVELDIDQSLLFESPTIIEPFAVEALPYPNIFVLTFDPVLRYPAEIEVSPDAMDLYPIAVEIYHA